MSKKEYDKFYREKNRERILKRNKIYYLKNKTKLLEQVKKYNKIHKAEKAEYQKEYYETHKKEHSIKAKEYRRTHKEQRKEWEKANKDKIQIYRKNYFKYKFYNDINFKLITNLRSRLHHALKGGIKSKRTMKLIGCNINFLREYLKKQFTNDMSWLNYGKKGWEVDHIKPCTRFDLSKPSEQHKCFHYTNLQPLWVHENRVKGAK